MRRLEPGAALPATEADLARPDCARAFTLLRLYLYCLLHSGAEDAAGELAREATGLPEAARGVLAAHRDVVQAELAKDLAVASLLDVYRVAADAKTVSTACLLYILHPTAPLTCCR